MRLTHSISGEETLTAIGGAKCCVHSMRLLRNRLIRCKRVNDATIGADAIGAPADTAGAFIAIGSN